MTTATEQIMTGLNMNPDVRAQWCAALRSGDYQQGTGNLRAGGRYCCLGVLTDLWLKAGHSEMVSDDLGAVAPLPVISVWDNIEGALSLPVMEWAGLDSRDPDLDDVTVGCGNAIYLNDSGHTFMEIADLIDGGAS